LAVGSQVFEGQGFPTPYYRRVVAVRYAPNGDLDGNGCVDDADLLGVLFAFGQQGADLAADLNGDATRRRRRPATGAVRVWRGVLTIA
jgi:hypothetical protein